MDFKDIVVHTGGIRYDYDRRKRMLNHLDGRYTTVPKQILDNLK